MFNGCADATQKARNIVSFLNEHEDSKTHARHINIDEAKQCGLRIQDLEDDETLQDLVLTVHHCFMHTFANANAIKIIENQNGIAVVMNQPVN
jgi:hypothetical protein